MSSLMPDEEVQDHLLKEDPEYRKLAEEHQSYDVELEDLTHKHFLSEEEQLKERTLKKKKLLLKDQMYSMVQKYRRDLQTESR